MPRNEVFKNNVRENKIKDRYEIGSEITYEFYDPEGLVVSYK